MSASEGRGAGIVDSICARRNSSARIPSAIARFACAAESAAPYALRLPWKRDATTACSAASALFVVTGVSLASTRRE